MNPDHAKFLTETLGQQLQTEWMTTYKVIEAIPEGKKDWKPEPVARTAWELAQHLAVADVGFLHAVIANDFTNTFPGKTTATTARQLADWYKHEMPKALEQVLALDGAHMSKIVEFYGMKLPSASYVLFCLTHMIHHRGQLATYLRPMGGKVPSIYGGSADEPYKG
ncbi:MAG: DinB family protein [Vicinamibacterales bacterium]